MLEIKLKKAETSQKLEQLGNVTGAHLHFEIRINDVCIDPRSILAFQM